MKLKTKKQTKNTTKTWFFEKFNKNDKPLARFTEEKNQERENKESNSVLTVYNLPYLVNSQVILLFFNIVKTPQFLGILRIFSCI